MPKVTPAHVEARRAQILEAACKCFADKGFHQTTIRDICTEAGLSAGAVYGYFKSKDEIVEALAEVGRRNTRAALAPPVSDGQPPHTPSGLLSRVMQFLASEQSRESTRLDLRLWGESLHTPQLLRLVLEAVENLIEPFEESVRVGQERGEISERLDAPGAARVFVAICLGFSVQRAIDPGADLSGCREVVSAMLDGSFASRGPR